MYLTLRNSKVLGTWGQKYLILVQKLSSTFVKLTEFSPEIFEYIFFNTSPLNTIIISYWNGSYCVCSQHGVSGHQTWIASLDLQAPKYLNSLAPEIWGCNVVFKLISRIGLITISVILALVECHKISLMTTGSQHFSGNDLVPSGNKPVPEPMLTQICEALWCH